MKFYQDGTLPPPDYTNVSWPLQIDVGGVGRERVQCSTSFGPALTYRIFGGRFVTSLRNSLIMRSLTMRRSSFYTYQQSRIKKIQKISDTSLTECRQGMYTTSLEATVPTNHHGLAAKGGRTEQNGGPCPHRATQTREILRHLDYLEYFYLFGRRGLSPGFIAYSVTSRNTDCSFRPTLALSDTPPPSSFPPTLSLIEKAERKEKN